MSEERKSRRISRMYMEDASPENLQKEIAKQKVEEKKKEEPKFEAPKRIGYEDMTKMEDMSLEAVLENLKERYEQNLIYTYTAQILVAINPFKRLPVYGKQWVKYYKGKRLGLLAPHIYAVAEAAYDAMATKLQNQSVLVSGESGAGKTECTKLILQFLSARTDRQSNIETMVLESVPVLEAFGNAKTSRNDNSSRFGKFIEIQFDNEYFITGSKIIPYLLEKSRLISQNPGERNYHIFYQLTEGQDEAARAKYFLKRAKDYEVLNKTGCITIDGVDEHEELEQLKKALLIFEISAEISDTMFKIVAACLHLGNISYKDAGDGAEIDGDDSEAELEHAATLLELEKDALKYALTHKKIQMRSEIIHKPLSAQLAKDQTHSFLKYLYAVMFEWMVNKLNACTHAEVYKNFIGVLDIFGFELFEFNTFEQFLINFANEKLQNFFNHHIFTLEQLEYEKEGVDWTTIEFKDNQPCLDLIEKRRPVGILAVLDEECRFPKATDESFIGKLHQNFEKGNEYYVKPRLAKSTFAVKHYAGEVTYDTKGWRDKNKDELPGHLLELIRASSNKFIAILYTPEKEEKKEEDEDEGRSRKKKDSGKATLGTQFKEQLNALMTMLGTTDPYFIRCVKPNMEKVPNKFTHDLVYAQLLNAGMMETISIRRMGYPIRYTLEDFWKRYKCICPEVTPTSGDWTKTCKDLITALGITIPQQTQVGKTKIFLKQDVANDLEDRRNVALTSTILKLQVWWRMANHRAAFVEQSTNAHAIQTWWRMAVLRKRFVKNHHAAIKAQSWYRMVLAMRKRKELLEKKRKEEEERKKKEEEERKKLEAKLGKEKAAEVMAEKEKEKVEAEKAEAEKIRALAAGEITVPGTEELDEEAKKKEEEEKKQEKEKEKEKKKKKKEKSRKSIMMKKGQELEVPINVDGRITLGLGWVGGQWDLDASCLMFRYKQHRDDVYYYKPRSKDGSVIHKGGYAGIVRNNATEGDAEQIEVNLNKVAAKTNTLIFVVTVFSPEGNFSSVKNAYVRLVDSMTDSEYCRYTLDQSGNETARIMCKLYRWGFSRWRVKAIGAPGEGRLYKHMINKVEPYLTVEPPKRRFKVRVHRGKLVDIKSMYKGDKTQGLSTMCEIRYDTESKKTKLIKKSLNPQWKSAREVSGHGDIMEVNVINRVRFGKEVSGGFYTKAAGGPRICQYIVGRIYIELTPKMNVREQLYELEQRGKARSRHQTAVSGTVKLSIIER